MKELNNCVTKSSFIDSHLASHRLILAYFNEESRDFPSLSRGAQALGKSSFFIYIFTRFCTDRISIRVGGPKPWGAWRIFAPPRACSGGGRLVWALSADPARRIPVSISNSVPKTRLPHYDRCVTFQRPHVRTEIKDAAVVVCNWDEHLCVVGVNALAFPRMELVVHYVRSQQQRAPRAISVDPVHSAVYTAWKSDHCIFLSEEQALVAEPTAVMDTHLQGRKGRGEERSGGFGGMDGWTDGGGREGGVSARGERANATQCSTRDMVERGGVSASRGETYKNGLPRVPRYSHKM